MKRGAVARAIYITRPEPLSVDDLSRLAGARRSIGSVKRLRASHHTIARLSAYGLTGVEIAAQTGYTSVRVNHLLNSPAMEELVAKYRERIEEKQAESLDAFIEMKTANMLAAERHIADHIAELDENDELLPIKTALAISADGADRVGYGKKQTNLNVNVDFAAGLERAIRRTQTINGTVVPATEKSVVPQTSSREQTPQMESHGQPLLLRRA